MKERVKVLEIQVQQLTNAVNQQTKIIEQLAALGGYEYSQDLKDWVSKEKLDALRKAPR